MKRVFITILFMIAFAMCDAQTFEHRGAMYNDPNYKAVEQSIVKFHRKYEIEGHTYRISIRGYEYAGSVTMGDVIYVIIDKPFVETFNTDALIEELLSQALLGNKPTRVNIYAAKGK